MIQELQKEFATAIILITHDLGVVAGFCDKVLVMYAGKAMEYAETGRLFEDPQHPYTLGLLDAIPRLEVDCAALKPIPGDPPNLLVRIPGCQFQTRCSVSSTLCDRAPGLTLKGELHAYACHHPGKGVRCCKR